MRSSPSNLSNCKVWCKITILEFGTILICVFLGVEFENTIAIFETNTLIAKFREQECLNLGPKVPDLSIFVLEFEKTLSYLKSASLTLSCCKVGSKVKILKFRTKNV